MTKDALLNCLPAPAQTRRASPATQRHHVGRVRRARQGGLRRRGRARLRSAGPADECVPRRDDNRPLSARSRARTQDARGRGAWQKRPREAASPRFFSGWHQDPDFLDGDRKPARYWLPTARARSFAALLGRYAGDTPHGALTKELLKLGLVAQKRRRQLRGLRARVRSRRSRPRHAASDRPVAVRPWRNARAQRRCRARTCPPRFEGMATSPRIEAHYVNTFYDFLDSRGQAFLEEIDAWLAEHQSRRIQSFQLPQRPAWCRRVSDTR